MGILMRLLKTYFSLAKTAYVLCYIFLFSATVSHAQNNNGNDSEILDKIITPDLERRVITEDKLDSENWEIGIYTGIFSIEDFGSNTVVGLKATYYVTEKFFVEANYGVTKAGKTSTERLFTFVDSLSEEQREYSYYNASVGYNLFPGEVFWGGNTAFNTDIYILAGIGNTTFNNDEFFTYSFGAGFRFYAKDWLAFNLTIKDHIFDSNVIGDTVAVNNLEATLGISMYF